MSESAPRTRLKATAAVSALFIIVVVALTAATSSPRACAVCHPRQSAALAEAGHTGVGCYACHLAAGPWSFLEHKTREIGSMYPAYIAGRRTPAAGTRVSRAACVGCHRAALSGTITADGLIIAHESCAPYPAKCDACHSDAAHPTHAGSRGANMDECLSCHVDNDAPLRCERCHASDVPTQTVSAGTLAVTHGPNRERTHGLADLRTCSTCHDQSECAECHNTRLPHPDSFMLEHGDQARQPDARCAECHRTREFCDSCHGSPMPHPDTFRRDHMTAATSRRDDRCLRCHREYDCANCHARHVHPEGTDGTLGSDRMPRVEVSD